MIELVTGSGIITSKNEALTASNTSVLYWHVRHAEQYNKAYSDRHLATHTAQDIEQYL